MAFLTLHTVAADAVTAVFAYIAVRALVAVACATAFLGACAAAHRTFIAMLTFCMFAALAWVLAAVAAWTFAFAALKALPATTRANRSRASRFIFRASARAVIGKALFAVIAVLTLCASWEFTTCAMLFAFVASVAFFRFGASRWMVA